MLRSDSFGVTSVIRDLNLSHSSYATMIHFFHSSSWKLETIAQKWTEIVKSFAPIYQEDGVTILVGDGVKASKEASYLRKNIFSIMAKNTGLTITKIIKKKQLDPSFYEELKASQVQKTFDYAVY